MLPNIGKRLCKPVRWQPGYLTPDNCKSVLNKAACYLPVFYKSVA